MNLPLIPTEVRCRHLTSRPNEDGSAGDCPPYGCLAGYKRCEPLYADPAGGTMPACPKFHNRAFPAAGKKPLTLPLLTPAPALPGLTGKCFHLGDATGKTVTCPTCRGNVALKTFACGVHGTCVTPTDRKEVPGVGCCKGCRQFTTEVPFVKETLVDPVPRTDPREAFNASLFRRANGKLYLAYRTGQGGCNIHVAPMSDSLEPGPSSLLNLIHNHCRQSREDPRLFEHRGKLHVSFVGVVGDPVNGKGNTHVLHAALRDDLSVEKVSFPKYARMHPTWEKSWGFFEWQNELFAVYTISPHVVLHCNGDEALPFSEHKIAMPWAGGNLRGGASPIRVGDEYWSWFHGSVDQGQPTPSGPAGTRVYNVGVYAFEAKPPFRPTRITPSPVLWGSHDETGKCWCDVVFPCGAVLDGDTWRVSAGKFDREIRVYEWRHADIEKAMVRV